MHTMLAAVLHHYNQALQLREIPRPTAGPDQVLVRIRASGVNPLDTRIAAGQAAHVRTVLPAILGLELAGVVEAIGDGVSEFAVGDAVYGMTGGIAGVPGSLAQYAAVDARLLAPKPHNFSLREAAALPLVFITAWEGLVERANMRAGQKVLVHGGAGDVGMMAIQIARAYGAEVYATGEASQLSLLASLGAKAIDLRTTSVDDYVQQFTDGAGFDIVYDTLGGASLDAGFQAARCSGGHVVSCLGWGRHALAPLSRRAATYSGVFSLLPLISGEGRETHGAILHEASRLAECGKLQLRIAPETYTLATVGDAHARLATGHADGKLIVNID